MKVIIIGAGSTAYHAADLITSDHNFILEGFIGTKEEEEKYNEKELYGFGRFLGDHSLLPKFRDEGIVGFIVAVGDNKLREQYFYDGQKYGLYPVNAISQQAIIQKNVRIGKGVIVNPGVILCNGVTVGDNVILEAGVICDVNVTVGDHVSLGPGSIISGIGASIGKNVSVGAKSYVSSFVGKNNIINVGSIVTDNIEDQYREE